MNANITYADPRTGEYKSRSARPNEIPKNYHAPRRVPYERESLEAINGQLELMNEYLCYLTDIPRIHSSIDALTAAVTALTERLTGTPADTETPVADTVKNESAADSANARLRQKYGI